MSQFFGTNLAGDRFVPDDARCALIVVHGLGEHRGRYRAVVERLMASGIACFTYDQRGHGDSPGRRTHIGDFSELTSDLSRIVQGVRASYPTWPIFLWGHSLGSIVVLSYVLQHPEGIRGGITTGSPLAALPQLGGALSTVGATTFNLLPEIRVNTRLDPVLLSHDPNTQTTYRDDPLVTKSVTLELVFQLSETMNTIKKLAHTIRVPWLAIHGADDEIAPPEGSKLLVDALGSNDKKLVIIDGSRHEVQNEMADQRERLLALIAEWVVERTHQPSERVRPGSLEKAH